MTAASCIMKKIFLLLLTAFSFLASQSVYASAEVENGTFVNDSVFYQDGIYYQLIADKNGNKDEALAVIDWDPEMTEVNIPEGIYVPDKEEAEETTEPAMYDKHKVPSRGTRRYKFIIWFKPRQRLLAETREQFKVRTILFSMDIEFDPDIDFSVYKYLASLDLPQNMKEIRPRCFKNCKGLRSITIKKNIERIGEEAFAGCTSLQTVNCTYEKLQSIGDRAFADCTSLRYLNLSGSYALRNIGSEAFLNCNSLTNVYLPEYMYSLSRSAFKGCENISTFNIGNYREGCSFYTYDNCIYQTNNLGKRELYIVPPTKKTIVLDSEAKQIDDRILYGHKHLSTIYIPDNIDYIGEAAFANCKELKKIRLSERLKTISDSCFYGCEKLEQVKLPESIENIGNWTFGYCNSINTIEIPSHVKKIGDGAFADCSNLQNFTVSDWNTEFTAHNGVLYNCGYKYAYSYTPYDLHLICCPGGKNEVTINEETVKILDYSFYGCRKLASLHIPAKVFYIYPRAFHSCDSLIDFTVSDESTRYKSIDGMIIDYSNSLCAFPGGREEAIINPLTKIEGSNTDYDTIERDAFYGSNKLRKISFLTFVRIYAPNFLGCDNITEINLYDYPYIETIYPLEPDAFTPKVYETAQLNVYYNPKDSWITSSIQEFPYWSKFKNINYIETSGIEDITIDDSTDDDASTTIYSINGIKLGNSIDNLKPGTYIIRQGNKSKKIIKL